MPIARRRIRAALAVVAIAAMTASTVGQAPDATARIGGQPAPARSGGQPAAADTAGFDWASLVPTAASLQSVAAGVPDDPIAAAEHLAEIVWGDDSLAAVSATGEILRRAGLPLVSADGPVVALPEGGVITDAPVLVELLPTLTDAARAGTMHTPDQVAELLEVVGFAAEVPDGRDVVGLLAAWGKSYGDRGPDDIAEVRGAGAAARALARIRGQLLVPATVATPEQQRLLAGDPGALPGVVSDWLTSPTAVTGIDPITTVMLLAHAAGELATDVSVTPASRGLRGAVAGAFHGNGGGSGCEALEDASDSRADTEVKGGAKEYVKGETRDAAEAAAERYGGTSGKKWTKAGGEAYDKITDAISVVLLLLGAKLELEADKTATHFRHKPGDRSGDVTVTATASFSSALAKRHLACWSLIGIDVPPDGKLEGYTVNWRMSKAPQAFQAFSDSRDKFAKGDVTGPDGVSTVSVYPRTELSPPDDGETQPELTVNATVYAGLDKDDFPWKLSDLVDIATSGGLGGAALKALYALLMNLVKRGALPTMAIHIPVTYHGQMPFVMIGDMNAASSFVSISIDFRADLYSCTGPLGPWQGTAGSGGDVSIRHTGSAPQISGSGQADVPMRFELAKTAQPQRFHVADGVGIEVELDVGEVERILNPTVVRDMYDSMQGKAVVVGTGTWTLEGQEVARQLGGASTMSWAAGSERFDVVSRTTDDRCGGSSYWADQRFDRTERG